MAEEGRGQRHSAPKVAPVTGQPFKSFDNASRRTKRQKGHCMELQGIALFWFAPKFTPSKIFEPQKNRDQQTASSHKPKSSKKPFSNGENGWLDLKSVI